MIVSSGLTFEKKKISPMAFCFFFIYFYGTKYQIQFVIYSDLTSQMKMNKKNHQSTVLFL